VEIQEVEKPGTEARAAEAAEAAAMAMVRLEAVAVG